MLATIRSSHAIQCEKSAYASGALVKCRKVGAKNWGNKSESFEVQDGVVEGVMPEIDPKKHKDAQKKQKMRESCHWLMIILMKRKLQKRKQADPR